MACRRTAQNLHSANSKGHFKGLIGCFIILTHKTHSALSTMSVNFENKDAPSDLKSAPVTPTEQPVPSDHLPTQERSDLPSSTDTSENSGMEVPVSPFAQQASAELNVNGLAEKSAKIKRQRSITNPLTWFQGKAETVEASEAQPDKPEAADPKEPELHVYDLQNKITLLQAFTYAFSEEASRDVAQANFTQATGDHYCVSTSYTRESFIEMLQTELEKNPGYCTSAFCQIFLNITAYVHQFVDIGLDRFIVLEFAKHHSKPSALQRARAPGNDMKPAPFSNGFHTTYLSYIQATDKKGLKPSHHLLCLETQYIDASAMQSLANVDHKRCQLGCSRPPAEINVAKLTSACTERERVLRCRLDQCEEALAAVQHA